MAEAPTPPSAPQSTSQAASAQTPYERAREAALVMLVANAVLCLMKVAAGWWGHSFALTADGINNLTDVGLSAALFVALRLAALPPDAKHPYGHGKIEPEVARLVGLFILATSGGIFGEAASRFSDEHQAPSSLVLVVASAAIVVKEVMYRYMRRIAEETNSGALMADALNHRFDVAATGCVLLGTLGVTLGGPSWAFIDDVSAMAVAVLMAVLSVRLILSSSSELLDEMPPDDVLMEVRRIAAEVPKVRGVEKLLGRKVGLKYFLDIHVELPPEMTVQEGHEIARKVRDRIIEGMPNVAGVLVHMEPAERGAEEAATRTEESNAAKS